MRYAPFALVMAAAIALPAFAAPAQKLPANVTVSADKTRVTFTHVDGARTAAKPSSLPVIFDNFAEKYPHGRYSPNSGYGVYGPNSIFPTRGWAAMPFTPAADGSITRVEVPLKYVSGTNRAILSIRQDNAGVPGAALQSWTVKGMITGGTCCTVTHVSSNGIPVQAGHRYWVMLSTDTHSKDAFLTWCMNVTEPLLDVDIARDQGDGWTIHTQAPGSAFAVYGAAP
ncbi:MAG TPA: choice-of-anchor R domain-containing protein [Rhizomicrobium sp.]|jgi:hypothetical protein|nr:choice-of-anchor R domain-containing protein [Rhizomicrobium sp.]